MPVPTEFPPEALPTRSMPIRASSRLAPALPGRAVALRLSAGLIALVLLLAGSIASAQSSRHHLSGSAPATAQSRPIDQAQAALRARTPARALAIADQGLKNRPADPELRFVRGVALVALQRSDEAESTFRGLTQDYPELPEPYNNLAYLLAARGDLEGARQALDEAVRALPDYALAHENLGDILVRLAARHYAEAARLATGANRVLADSASTKLRLLNDIQTGIMRPPEPGPASASPKPADAR